MPGIITFGIGKKEIRTSLSPEEHLRRLHLYENGLDDVKMAESLELTTNAVCKWREKWDFPSNIPGWQLSQGQKQEIRRLHEAGLNDGQIGQKLRLKHRTVAYWRKTKYYLPPNQLPGCPNPVSETEKALIKELHSHGLNDRQIAARLGRSTTTVRHRRTELSLPPQRAWKSFSEADKTQVRQLHAEGLTDSQIGRRLNRVVKMISDYRKKMGLPKNLFEHHCVICDSTFMHNHPNTKYCERCRGLVHQINFERSLLIKKMIILAKTNPEEAKKFESWIAAEEGDEFKEFAIDGIVDKEIEKMEVFRKRLREEDLEYLDPYAEVE